MTFAERIGFNLLGVALKSVLGLYASTMKVEVRGSENEDAVLHSGRHPIFALWHGQAINFISFRMKYQLPMAVVMASRSKDGEIGSALIRRMGVLPVRASSSRGGAEGLIEFHGIVNEWRDRGVTLIGGHALDGPRGPRHQAKRGILKIARQNNALIVPLISGASRAIHVKSWDRHSVPLPFGRIVVQIGKPIDACAAEGAAKEKALSPDSPFDYRPELTIEEFDSMMRDFAESDPLCRIENTLEEPARFNKKDG